MEYLNLSFYCNVLSSQNERLAATYGVDLVYASNTYCSEWIFASFFETYVENDYFSRRCNSQKGILIRLRKSALMLTYLHGVIMCTATLNLFPGLIPK